MGNPGRATFGPKVAAQQLLLSFDFISYLSGSEIISTPVVTCTVWSGVDANPSAMISGSATVSGSIATQKVIGGVPGVIYYLTCQVSTGLGQVLTQSGFLAVLPQPVP